FERWDVGDHMRQKNVVRTDAVYACVVLIVAGAVHVKFQRPRRIARDGVRIDRRRKSGQCPVNLLVVSAEWYREVCQFIGDQVRVYFGSIGLKDRSLCRDQNSLGNGSKLKR